MDTATLSRLKALGGAAFLAQLIELHQQRCRRRLAALETACREQAWGDAREQVLALRAEAEEVGAADLLPQARELEQLLLRPEAPPPERLAGLLAGLREELAAMVQELDQHQHVA